MLWNVNAKTLGGVLLIIITLVLLQCSNDDDDNDDDDNNKVSIQLSRTSVSFGAMQGRSTPGPQTVTITGIGNTGLTGLDINIAYTDDQPTGWLTTSLNQTMAPATLTLRATLRVLPAGTYNADVSVSSPIATNTPQTVSVTFSVSPGSHIAISRTSVNFSATQGASNPSPELITVSNSGSGNLTELSSNIIYEDGQPAEWLGATWSQTTAPATLTLRATVGGLPIGVYHANVLIVSPVAINSPQNIAVIASVTAPPAGFVKVVTSTSGDNIDATGYYVSVTVGNGLAQGTDIAANSFVLLSGVRSGVQHVELNSIAANCSVVGVNPRNVNVISGETVETTFEVVCEAPPPPPPPPSPFPRQLTLKNMMPGHLNIHDIVQVKVALTAREVQMRDDLLTPDPAECVRLPGESIKPGQSRTFDINVGDNYFVFIGIGIWDLSFLCPTNAQFFKRRFFTEDPTFKTWYVWTTVQVRGHTSGNWQWTITGSYLNLTLKVAPTGQTGILFRRTQENPIP